MWYALAVWLAMGDPITMPVVKVPFNSKSECIEYIIENSDFNMMIHEQPHIVWLDDGVQDQFAIVCQTRVVEAHG